VPSYAGPVTKRSTQPKQSLRFIDISRDQIISGGTS
jgi:hypothetical protein